MTLLKANQPSGFDCPGCAWPDPKHTSSFEFCENGAKAVTWESTAKRAGPEFFARHKVADLWNWTDHNAIEAVEAILAGESKALVCLGGNLAVAMSDPEATFGGMRKLDLAVHIATKLNRSHLLTAKTSLVLPCLGRTDLDTQASGPQAVTVEDSMSMVHASRGFLKPPSGVLKSEPAIIANIAKATLGDRHGIDWDGLIANYDRIRDKIEEVFPDFHEFSKRARVRGGFRLDVAASFRRWNTENGKANFLVASGLDEDPLIKNRMLSS